MRRIAQLKRLFPRAEFSPIRGNLDTRLRKLDAGDNAALVLAAAGLRRLGFQSRISLRLPATLCVPAPGQGIIAIEIRDGDEAVRAAVSTITDPAAWAALAAERALVEALGGGCQTPIGALASPDGDERAGLARHRGLPRRQPGRLRVGTGNMARRGRTRRARRRPTLERWCRRHPGRGSTGTGVTRVSKSLVLSGVVEAQV